MFPPDTIYFYAQTDPYAEFSNFAPYGVRWTVRGGLPLSTSSRRRSSTIWTTREKICRADRPRPAKALGMTRQVPLRADWEEVKDGVMLGAVRAKFRTHAKLAMLLSTGDRMIVENAPMDAYWGCGPDGSGLNKLGQILMQVRSELRLS